MKPDTRHLSPVTHLYRIPDATLSFCQNLRAESASVHEAAQDGSMAQPGEVRAWLAEAYAAQAHRANLKFLADQIVERDSARDDVATPVARL